MSLRALNTNVASLNVQRRLAQTTQELRGTFERLSSGLRINRASDDAAGLSVASSLQTDSRVFGQAVRNVNDAISLFNIAEGATGELTSIVIRLRELASQSANGVLSTPQRGALDDEAQALREEFNRIVAVTEFNGLSLLNGETETLEIQTGYDAVALGLADIATSTVGDGTYQARTSFLTSNQNGKTAAGDFNGDGALDIVAGDSFGVDLTVYMGNGDGTFQTATTLSSGNSPNTMVVRDFNGDGVLDIAASATNGQTIDMFIGNGNGTFQARISFSTNSSPVGLVAADFNGDGKIDLVTPTYNGGVLNVFLGNGDATFQARLSYTAGPNPETIAAADLNGDGIIDLATGSLSARIDVLFGNGNGTFKATTTFQTRTTSVIPVAADVNGDGVVDLISADTPGFELFLGNGDGTYLARTSFAMPVSTRQLIVQDFNSDGIVDIVTAAASTSVINMSFGNGNGTFLAPTSYAAATNPSGITAGDFTSDGVVDFIVASQSGYMDLFVGNGVTSSTLSTLSLRTQSGALTAMDMLEGALAELSTVRGDIGSSVSRLQVAASTLATSRENYDSAASQIVDADIATESARLVRLNILQPAGAAVLSQANQLPALVLRLLNGAYPPRSKG